MLERAKAAPTDQAGPRLSLATNSTSIRSLAEVPSSRAFAMAEMRKSGVEFHSLAEQQLAERKAAAGYQRPEWCSFKKELTGSMEVFDKMVEAAGIKGKYYVHDASPLLPRPMGEG
jgi:hypothetical protein